MSSRKELVVGAFIFTPRPLFCRQTRDNSQHYLHLNHKIQRMLSFEIPYQKKKKEIERKPCGRSPTPLLSFILYRTQQSQ